MRVLHFGRFYAGDRVGGIERHVATLLQGLAAHIEVDDLVANLAWRSDVVRAPGYDVYRARSLGIVASVPLAPTLPLIARRLWSERRYDLAHLHFPDPLSLVAAALLPGRPKIVVTWHSDVIRQRSVLPLYRLLLDRFLPRIAALVAATPKHFETSTQLGALPASVPRTIIPYGIDAAQFHPTEALLARAAALRAQWPAGPVVFAVGRHIYYKGFEFAIRAMRSVEGTLLLGGSGPLLQQHRRLARELGLGSKVIFPGEVADEDLPAYYRAADLFCFPSVEQSEAFGLVQLEAMASGIPVVCSDLRNGVNFVTRHGESGLAVPPRDSVALAAALNELLGDPERRRRMGEAGVARVEAEFTAQRMVESHLQLYRSLAGSSCACTAQG